MPTKSCASMVDSTGNRKWSFIFICGERGVQGGENRLARFGIVARNRPASLQPKRAGWLRRAGTQ